MTFWPLTSYSDFQTDQTFREIEVPRDVRIQSPETWKSLEENGFMSNSL